MKAKTRNILTVCLALALMASAILGTIAYMTASDSKTNTFTVGKFDKPTTDPDSPGTSLDPELHGYILEKSWNPDEEHKLVPGGDIAKDPQIGIGKGSEEAYVYAFVENNMVYSGESEEATVIRDSSVYFQLKEGWEFVHVDGIDYKELEIEGIKYYTGGLFKYNVVLNAATADAWTGEIFDTVTTGKDMNTAEMAKVQDPNYAIVVNAFIHQAKDGKNVDLAATAATAAVTWAKGIADAD